jgi:hypothetical protein
MEQIYCQNYTCLIFFETAFTQYVYSVKIVLCANALCGGSVCG